MLWILPLALDPRFRGDDERRGIAWLGWSGADGDDMRSKSRIADDLLTSLKQALDHAKGKSVAMRISDVTTEPTKVRRLKKSETAEKRRP